MLRLVSALLFSMILIGNGVFFIEVATIINNEIEIFKNKNTFSLTFKK